MSTTTRPGPRPTLDDHRRSARHHVDLPCDDGGELAHHLVAVYLEALGADLAADGTGLPDPRALLSGLGAVFAAVADRRQLAADDPALRALAALLLDAGEVAGAALAPAGLTAAA